MQGNIKQLDVLTPYPWTTCLGGFENFKPPVRMGCPAQLGVSSSVRKIPPGGHCEQYIKAIADASISQLHTQQILSPNQPITIIQQIIPDPVKITMYTLSEQHTASRLTAPSTSCAYGTTTILLADIVTILLGSAVTRVAILVGSGKILAFPSRMSSPMAVQARNPANNPISSGNTKAGKCRRSSADP